MADNIEFGINISTGASVQNIKAINTALSDFSHVALIAARKEAEAIEKARKPFPAWSNAMRDTASVFKTSSQVISSSIEQSGTKTQKTLHDWTETSARLRYALYDMANAAQQASQVFLALPKAAVGGAIAAERQFANVRRVLGDSVTDAEGLRQEFIKITQDIPASFKEVTQIGTLAGQLGIVSKDVANFTENIIKFSSVTGMTSEASATSLSRLNDLIPGVGGNYEALASSILKVGVNSAATESEIMAVAQQIAPVANTFNFSADAVIGFAGAMASLKIPPELSRGMLQRTFAIVNQAISSNSSDLERWGSVIGKSGAEFKQAWLSNSVMTFADTLRAIGQQGGAAEGTLVSLGITSSRDAATIKRLAQNVDSTLIPALANASSGFNGANEQQKQFDIISQTLAERIKKLVENFNNFINAAGSGVTAFGFLIDGATGLFKILTDFANNPFGKWLFFAIGGMTSLLGLTLGIIAIASRFRAGIIAVNTALEGMRAHFATVRAEAATTGTSLKGLSGIASATGLSFKALGTAMKATLVGLGISVAFALIGSAVEAFANSTKSAQDRVDELFPSLTDLRSAMQEDARSAQISGESVISYSDYLKNAGKQIDSSGNLIDAETSARDNNTSAIEGQTDALGNYTVAIGKATRKKIAETIFSSDAFKKIDEWNKKMSELGKTQFSIDMNKVLNFSTSGNTKALAKYIEDVKAQASASIQSWDPNSLGSMFNPGEWFGPTTAQKAEDAFNSIQQVATTASNAIGAAGNEALAAWIAGTTTATGTTQAWQMTLADVADGIKQVNTAATEAFTISDAVSNAADSFSNLIKGINESSGSFNMLTESGRQNAANFKSSVTDIMSLAYTLGIGSADAINIVYQQLKASGASTAELQLQLNGLVKEGLIDAATAQSIIAGTFQLSSKGKQLQNVFKNIADSTNTIGNNVAEVRTLVDYANDLAAVWKRAFDIRFSSQDALDNITKAWADMAEETKKAREQVQSLQDDIASLTADKALKEYFLSVADAYGDTLRAAQLRAELGKINTELASKTQEVTDAQNNANKTLKGNSTAAINNRNQIRDMITKYQTWVQNLAASGATQGQLNDAVRQGTTDFTNQAIALGYSREELVPYIASFKDMATAIGKVPRNVTIKFNNNPALQAIAEIEAKGKSAASNIGSSFSDSMTKAWQDLMDMYSKDERRQGLEQRRRTLQQSQDRKYSSARASEINRITKLLESGSYASGGYTGAGGKFQIAGVVHKGEYVIPREGVNQSNGIPNFMNQPRFFMPNQGTSSQSSGMIVSLSPADRAILRSVGGSGEVVLYANNEAIARSANAGNRSIVATGGRP